MFKNWLQYKFLCRMYYPGFQMLWDLWLPRPRSGHWLLQAASLSLGRGQAEESRKTQSEIIQAIVSSQLRKLASGRNWRAHISQTQTQCQLPRIKLFLKTVSLKDRLSLQAQWRRAAGGLSVFSSAEAGPSGQCEAAQLRPRPGAESPRLDNWLDQDAYF